MCSLGVDHVHGVDVARDVKRGLDLLYQAAELGNIHAYGKLGDMYNPELNNDYDNYNEAGKDLVTAIQYYELAAKGGHQQARYNLGILSRNVGKQSIEALDDYRSTRTYEALTMIKKGYIEGSVTKDEFAKATCNKDSQAQDEVGSEQRTKAANVRFLGVDIS